MVQIIKVNIARVHCQQAKECSLGVKSCWCYYVRPLKRGKGMIFTINVFSFLDVLNLLPVSCHLEIILLPYVKDLIEPIQMKKANFPTSLLKTIPIFPHFISLPLSFKKHQRM